MSRREIREAGMRQEQRERRENERIYGSQAYMSQPPVATIMQGSVADMHINYPNGYRVVDIPIPSGGLVVGNNGQLYATNSGPTYIQQLPQLPQLPQRRGQVMLQPMLQPMYVQQSPVYQSNQYRQFDPFGHFGNEWN